MCSSASTLLRHKNFIRFAPVPFRTFIQFVTTKTFLQFTTFIPYVNTSLWVDQCPHTTILHSLNWMREFDPFLLRSTAGYLANRKSDKSFNKSFLSSTRFRYLNHGHLLILYTLSSDIYWITFCFNNNFYTSCSLLVNKSSALSTQKLGLVRSQVGGWNWQIWCYYRNVMLHFVLAGVWLTGVA